jgi:hypothetical protein
MLNQVQHDRYNEAQQKKFRQKIKALFLVNYFIANEIRCLMIEFKSLSLRT